MPIQLRPQLKPLFIPQQPQVSRYKPPTTQDTMLPPQQKLDTVQSKTSIKFINRYGKHVINDNDKCKVCLFLFFLSEATVCTWVCCKSVYTVKGCTFAQQFNILESPKYAPSLIFERGRAAFTSAG